MATMTANRKRCGCSVCCSSSSESEYDFYNCDTQACTFQLPDLGLITKHLQGGNAPAPPAKSAAPPKLTRRKGTPVHRTQTAFDSLLHAARPFMSSKSKPCPCEDMPAVWVPGTREGVSFEQECDNIVQLQRGVYHALLLIRKGETKRITRGQICDIRRETFLWINQHAPYLDDFDIDENVSRVSIIRWARMVWLGRDRLQTAL